MSQQSHAVAAGADVDSESEPTTSEDEVLRSLAAMGGQIYRYALLTIGDPAEAEDVVAAAVARTLARSRRVRIREPAAYLRRAVSNELISRIRRRRLRHLVPLGSVTDVAAEDLELGCIDDRLVVWAAVRRLPARQRGVVILRYGFDLSEQQTADALGTSVGTVKSQHAKALRKLRSILQEDPMGDHNGP